MLDDKFIASIPKHDVFQALQAVLNEFLRLREDRLLVKDTDRWHRTLLELLGLWAAVSEKHGEEFPLPKLDGDIEYQIRQIVDDFENWSVKMQEYFGTQALEGYKKRFSLMLGGSFAYEFTDGDLRRIQLLLNELRTLIGDYNGFQDDHRRRLLLRLESLQGELHKRVSDLDRFYGFILDIGALMRQFGEDAKPMVDRARELMGIVWRTQARTQELPSDSEVPLLGHRSENGAKSPD